VPGALAHSKAGEALPAVQRTAYGEGDRERSGVHTPAASAAPHGHGQQRRSEDPHRDRTVEEGPIVQAGGHELEVERGSGGQQFNDQSRMRKVAVVSGQRPKAHGHVLK
jgi:hypothetical protein